jgi:hypothetical protein
MDITAFAITPSLSPKNATKLKRTPFGKSHRVPRTRIFNPLKATRVAGEAFPTASVVSLQYHAGATRFGKAAKYCLSYQHDLSLRMIYWGYT